MAASAAGVIARGAASGAMARFGAAIPNGVRIYAIGDIHGRLDLLERLIAQIRDDVHARGAAIVKIVLLGDLIDRGPQSAAIVDRCRALVARHEHFIVLKGNHEAMMVHAIRGNFAAFALWMRHGGDAALRSWGVPAEILAGDVAPAMMMAVRKAIPSKTIAWLDALPLTLTSGDYFFVHAGIRPGIAFDDQSNEDLLWIRGEFLDCDVEHSRMIVHGHSIGETGAVFRPNRIGIDTGAYRTGVLTALGLERNERWTLTTSEHDLVPRPTDTIDHDVAEIMGARTARGATLAPAKARSVALFASIGLVASSIAIAGYAWLTAEMPGQRSPRAANEHARAASLPDHTAPIAYGMRTAIERTKRSPKPLHASETAAVQPGKPEIQKPAPRSAATRSLNIEFEDSDGAKFASAARTDQAKASGRSPAGGSVQGSGRAQDGPSLRDAGSLPALPVASANIDVPATRVPPSTKAPMVDTAPSARSPEVFATSEEGRHTGVRNDKKQQGVDAIRALRRQ